MTVFCVMTTVTVAGKARGPRNICECVRRPGVLGVDRLLVVASTRDLYRYGAVKGHFFHAKTHVPSLAVISGAAI